MRVFAVLLLFVVVGCLAQQTRPTRPEVDIDSIQGTWTDTRYGGKTYLCVDNDYNVWGTFSGIGVYWGRTNDVQNQAKGRWYGLNNDCNSGDWEALYVNNNNTQLFFNIRCDSNLGVVTNFTQTRLSNVANDDQCLVVSNQTDFTGSWYSAQYSIQYFDICTPGNNDDGDASFESTNLSNGFNNTLLGYARGKAWENDGLFQASYTVTDDLSRVTNGNLIFFPRSENQAAMLYSTANITVNNTASSSIYYPLRRRSFTAALCEQNRYITGDDSSATIATVSVLLLAVSFVFLF